MAPTASLMPPNAVATCGILMKTNAVTSVAISEETTCRIDTARGCSLIAHAMAQSAIIPKADCSCSILSPASRPIMDGGRARAQPRLPRGSTAARIPRHPASLPVRRPAAPRPLRMCAVPGLARLKSAKAGMIRASPAEKRMSSPFSDAIASPAVATRISSRVSWCGRGDVPGSSATRHTAFSRAPRLGAARPVNVVPGSLKIGRVGGGNVGHG